jgi:hypothetical protein
MEEVLWRCRCNQESVIDLDNLESRPLDKLMTVHGFRCGFCGGWEAVKFETISLRDAFTALLKISVTRRDYLFHFARALRKAEGVQKRGREQWLAQISSHGFH